MKRELAVVIDELLAGNLSSGRRYEKRNAGDDLHSVRLNQGYRFVFLLYPDHGTALPVAVGPPGRSLSSGFRGVSAAASPSFRCGLTGGGAFGPARRSPGAVDRRPG